MTDSAPLIPLLLSAASTVVRSIDERMAHRGFGDTRPAYGFAFTRLSPAGATVGDIAAQLSMSKQAASQLVDEMAAKGYVERRPHPRDARAKLVVLTARGVECTRHATEVMDEILAEWSAALGPERVRELTADLSRMAGDGGLRPIW